MGRRSLAGMDKLKRSIVSRLVCRFRSRAVVELENLALDRDIVDRFRELVRRAHHGNYQTLINDALREHMQRPSLAQEVGKEVRSVLREELHRVKASA